MTVLHQSKAIDGFFKYIKYYVDNNFSYMAVKASRKLYIIVEFLLKFLKRIAERGWF